jgi:hypothetical protein
MSKVAILVLAGNQTHEGLGRVVNALEAAKEFKEGGDEVRIVFDGAGTAWVPDLASQEHRAHRLYAAVEDKVAGVCSYCAVAFGVKDKVQACGVRLAAEYDGHPSIRSLVRDGFTILTF